MPIEPPDALSSSSRKMLSASPRILFGGVLVAKLSVTSWATVLEAEAITSAAAGIACLNVLSSFILGLAPCWFSPPVRRTSNLAWHHKVPTQPSLGLGRNPIEKIWGNTHLRIQSFREPRTD